MIRVGTSGQPDTVKEENCVRGQMSKKPGDPSFFFGYYNTLHILQKNIRRKTTDSLLKKNPIEIVKEIEHLAACLGLFFNPKKCKVANYYPPLILARERIPIVNESQSYKYLGTPAGFTTLSGLEQNFTKKWKIAELNEMSRLTPMQKLRALRTVVLPKLMHLLKKCVFNTPNESHSNYP